VTVCEAATRVVANAQKILGAYSYAMEYDVQRYLRGVLFSPMNRVGLAE
jgi:alkylation response protein AidB-like acyl-CoA dehydrogenase